MPTSGVGEEQYQAVCNIYSATSLCVNVQYRHAYWCVPGVVNPEVVRGAHTTVTTKHCRTV